MKSLSIKVLICVSLMTSFFAQGQDMRIGYVNLTYIYDNLPEHQTLIKELETSSQKYQDIVKEKLSQYQTKVDAYQKLSKDGASSAIILDKENELQTLQKSIEDFRVNSDRDIRNNYESKFKPIEAKVDKAIKDYGAVNKYVYIYRMQANVGEGESWPFILYAANSDGDLSKNILSKLGVSTPTKEAAKPIIGLQAGMKK